MKEDVDSPSENNSPYREYSEIFKKKSYADAYDEGFRPDSLKDLFELKKLSAILVSRFETWAILNMMRGCKAKVVLDAPCGSGKIIRNLLDSGYSVIGLDASREMLSHCPRKEDRLNITQGDLRFIPIRNDFFKVIICHRFLHRIPSESRKETLSEVRRVCNQYAIFYFSLDGILPDVVSKMEKLLRMGDRGKIYSLSKQAIRKELSNSGWKFLKGRDVIPMISTGYVVLAEKEGTG